MMLSRHRNARNEDASAPLPADVDPVATEPATEPPTEPNPGQALHIEDALRGALLRDCQALPPQPARTGGGPVDRPWPHCRLHRKPAHAFDQHRTRLRARAVRKDRGPLQAGAHRSVPSDHGARQKSPRPPAASPHMGDGDKSYERSRPNRTTLWYGVSLYRVAYSRPKILRERCRGPWRATACRSARRQARPRSAGPRCARCSR